jgi:MFS transporter, putative metabolite:H+ symporter
LPAKPPWWAPPVAQDERTTTTMAAICVISALWSYGGGTGGLLTQTLPYAAQVYDVDDAALGTGLAVVRVGVLLALALGLVVDRVGRRRFILAAAVAHCLLTALVGLAPDFDTYVAGHVALRCLDVALGVALGVLAVESVPAGNRGLTLALLLLANGLGLAVAVAVLPLAAGGRSGLAAVYGLQLLALPLMVHAGRRLAESARFVAHAHERHRYRELLSPPYPRRVALVGIAALLAAAFFVPSAEFYNRYLEDVHGFSALGLVAFLFVTGTPSIPMLVWGGRLGDRYGRKRVGVPLSCAGGLALAGFFLADPPWIWALAFAASGLGSAGGAALAPYRSELFPTRIRSAAGTVVVAAAVAGSVIGLTVAGHLSSGLGVGPAIALLGLPALGAALLVAVAFPETAGRELEDTSAEASAAG